MTYQDALKQVADDTGIPLEVVKRAYESYWLFIRKTITDLPLKEELSEEGFSKLKTNFNIPSLGKLTCTYDRMQGVRKRFEYIRKLRDDSSKEN